jgi:hypothetical protein
MVKKFQLKDIFVKKNSTFKIIIIPKNKIRSGIKKLLAESISG